MNPLLRQAYIFFAWVLCCMGATAQPVSVVPASLTLVELLDNATHFYPSLRAARFEARASDEDTTAVRRQRWPTVSVTSETNSGNLRSYPTNAVQIQQTVWDFGRLSARIAEAEVTCPGKSGPPVVRISTWHLGEGHAKEEDLTREDHFAAAAD